MLLRRTVIAASLVTCVAGAHAAAMVGQPAPDFSLKDTEGKSVRLSNYRGHHVVLEWTNPHCPFVKKHYDGSNMQAAQREAVARGVVWLSVHSTARDHAEYLAPLRCRPGAASARHGPRRC